MYWRESGITPADAGDSSRVNYLKRYLIVIFSERGDEEADPDDAAPDARRLFGVEVEEFLRVLHCPGAHRLPRAEIDPLHRSNG